MHVRIIGMFGESIRQPNGILLVSMLKLGKLFHLCIGTKFRVWEMMVSLHIKYIVLKLSTN